jgi:hypothetical protein
VLAKVLYRYIKIPSSMISLVHYKKMVFEIVLDTAEYHQDKEIFFSFYYNEAQLHNYCS